MKKNIIFLSIITCIYSSLIQPKKTCADCKFFIPYKNACKLFGDIDLITGEYNYEKTNIVRFNENECSEEGIFFEKNNLKIITIPYYFVLENWKIIIIFTTYWIPYFLYIKLFFSIFFYFLYIIML
jgi:hypothetical protein